MKRISAVRAKSFSQNLKPLLDELDPLSGCRPPIAADCRPAALHPPETRPSNGVRVVRVILDVEIPMKAIVLSGLNPELLALYCRTKLHANAPQMWRVLVDRLRQKATP